LVAACFFASLLGLILSGPGGLVFWGVPVAASGGLMLLLVVALHFRRRKYVDEVRRAGAERLGQAQASADLHMRAVESLAIAIDAKDQTTHGHVRRTQVYALELGKLLNVGAGELEALKAGALLHDVGKLAVPEYILNKPGKLTVAEFEKMKVHTAVGGDIVRRVGFPYPVEDAVRFHHERWDGTGYPEGLKGERIPLVARIISVVDFYDSTRCERPYRAGMQREESLALLRRMAGKSFDPVVVEMFVKHIDDFDGLLSQDDLREQVQTQEATAATATNIPFNSVSSSSAQGSRDGAAGFRSIAQAQREVSALHEIAQVIGSSLSLPDTVALVACKLKAIVPFDACAIYAVDEQTGKAEPIFAAGQWAEVFSVRSMPVGEGITGWVIANARSMYRTPPALETANAPADVASQILDVISSPLVREDGAFGAITLYSKSEGAYTVEHLRLLESVCLHTSGALNNALIHERTKESALSDRVTGLPNARALHLMLEHRLAECRRYENETVAVLSIDLNDFKEVNEQYGHGVGDRVLGSVAAIIKSQLRQMDLLARYAGDEFVAVMPGASGEVAAMVAERVRAAVEAQDLPVKTGRSIQVGVGSGVGCYPADGDTADELLVAATRDMRRNKHARKLSHAVSTSSVVSIDAYR
jgi:diguanylate cyclase (GGDEF)-like protein/putative nucleotidyltransferase with HDIG domain